MDERKIVAYFIIRLWFLHIMALCMMWFMTNYNSEQRRQQWNAIRSQRFFRRNADTDIQKEMAKAFGEMISESVDQLKTITNSLVKGFEPRPDIDQIKALRLILEKASDERTFLTLDGAMRKAFVLLLLGQGSCD
ncbi:hypothetical protein ACE6H2_004013 [Prunus campanulata]